MFILGNVGQILASVRPYGVLGNERAAQGEELLCCPFLFMLCQSSQHLNTFPN